MSWTYSFNMVVGIDTMKMPSVLRQEKARLAVDGMLECQAGNHRQVLDERDPDAEILKGFKEVWLRLHSPMEVVVTNQGSEFKGVLWQKIESTNISQHVTNTEAPWTKRTNGAVQATIEEHCELTRECFEPPTEAENDGRIVQGCIAHNRYYDRSGFSSYQTVSGNRPRMPRILTPKDQHWTTNVHTTVELRPLRPSSNWTRTTGFRKQVRRPSVAPYPPKVGDWVMVLRCIVTSNRRWREGLACGVRVSRFRVLIITAISTVQTDETQCDEGCCTNTRRA